MSILEKRKLKRCHVGKTSYLEKIEIERDVASFLRRVASIQARTACSTPLLFESIEKDLFPSEHFKLWNRETHLWNVKETLFSTGFEGEKAKIV